MRNIDVRNLWTDDGTVRRACTTLGISKDVGALTLEDDAAQHEHDLRLLGETPNFVDGVRLGATLR